MSYHDRLVVTRDCFNKSLKLSQDKAVVVICFRVVWFHGKRFFIISDRFQQSTGALQRIPAIEICFGIVRLDRKRLVIARKRVVHPIKGFQRKAPVQVGFRKIRVDGDRFLITCDRFIRSIKRLQRQPIIRMERRKICFDLDRAGEKADGRFHLSCLECDQTRQMKGVEMKWIALKNVSIHKSGVSNAALLMQREAGHQSFHILFKQRRLARGAKSLTLLHCDPWGGFLAPIRADKQVPCVGQCPEAAVSGDRYW